MDQEEEWEAKKVWSWIVGAVAERKRFSVDENNK